MNKTGGPTVLLILDGWGLSPSWGGNALAMNNPRHVDKLWRSFPHAVLQALSAIDNGEVVGDSHLGHSMIGAGRLVKSNFGRINETIQNRSFYKNDVLLGAIDWAKRNNSNLHLIGLLSEGGIHSHLNHLLALLNLCQREDFRRVYVDAITDGTDSGPTDALRFTEKIEQKFSDLGFGAFSSVSGRFWAMDRDENWGRIRKYYEVLTNGSLKSSPSIGKAITDAYRQGINDEFIEPISIAQKNGEKISIKSNDAVVLFNFREDRSKEITRIFLDRNFRKAMWRPKKIDELFFATFVRYSPALPAKVAFPEKTPVNTLCEVLSKSNCRQLKIAESQKYAHVTSFFNGGDDTWPGEEIKIIASLNLTSFDQKPEMSAKEITDTTIRAIKSNRYDFIAVNFANVDMVAHTGNIIATGKAIQFLDEQVGKIVEANLNIRGNTIITADHGNAEQILEIKKNAAEAETTHTLNPVPFILVTPKNKKNLIQSALIHQSNALAKILDAKGTLADIAPTILQLLNIPKPKEMTGKSLIEKLE